jgi:hypothetical protein
MGPTKPKSRDPRTRAERKHDRGRSAAAVNSRVVTYKARRISFSGPGASTLPQLPRHFQFPIEPLSHVSSRRAPPSPPRPSPVHSRHTLSPRINKPVVYACPLLPLGTYRSRVSTIRPDFAQAGKLLHSSLLLIPVSSRLFNIAFALLLVGQGLRKLLAANVVIQ